MMSRLTPMIAIVLLTGTSCEKREPPSLPTQTQEEAPLDQSTVPELAPGLPTPAEPPKGCEPCRGKERINNPIPTEEVLDPISGEVQKD